MNKKNWWKPTFLTLAILACVSIPIILYFAIEKDTSDKINLNGQSVSYLADVQHMNNITGPEANKIKSDIETNVNNKMTSLKLEITVDYTIDNLEAIKVNVDLGKITITINSIATSKKAIGSFNLRLNIREDMSDRSIPTIDIPASEENNLSEDTLINTIILNIRINAEGILTNGQANKLDRDFQIGNKELLFPGAAFADYKDQISIIPVPSSTHLKGSFKINFQLQ